jgi:hypothetical protein
MFIWMRSIHAKQRGKWRRHPMALLPFENWHKGDGDHQCCRDGQEECGPRLQSERRPQRNADADRQRHRREQSVTPTFDAHRVPGVLDSRRRETERTWRRRRLGRRHLFIGDSRYRLT